MEFKHLVLFFSFIVFILSTLFCPKDGESNGNELFEEYVCSNKKTMLGFFALLFIGAVVWTQIRNKFNKIKTK